MNKTCQEQNEQDLWDAAIKDTERKLRYAEARAQRLKAAINTYKAHKAAGIAWPGNEKAEKADALSAISQNTETPTAV